MGGLNLSSYYIVLVNIMKIVQSHCIVYGQLCTETSVTMDTYVRCVGIKARPHCGHTCALRGQQEVNIAVLFCK